MRPDPRRGRLVAVLVPLFLAAASAAPVWAAGFEVRLNAEDEALSTTGFELLPMLVLAAVLIGIGGLLASLAGRRTRAGSA